MRLYLVVVSYILILISSAANAEFITSSESFIAPLHDYSKSDFIKYNINGHALTPGARYAADFVRQNMHKPSFSVLGTPSPSCPTIWRAWHDESYTSILDLYKKIKLKLKIELTGFPDETVKYCSKLKWIIKDGKVMDHHLNNKLSETHTVSTSTIVYGEDSEPQDRLGIVETDYLNGRSYTKSYDENLNKICDGTITGRYMVSLICKTPEFKGMAKIQFIKKNSSDYKITFANNKLRMTVTNIRTLNTKLGEKSILTAKIIPSKTVFDGWLKVDHLPNIINAKDPSSFEELTFLGEEKSNKADMRNSYRKKGFELSYNEYNFFVFLARFNKGKDVRVYINAEFRTEKQARQKATKYAKMLGQLPYFLRRGVANLVIHKGAPLSGAAAISGNIIIHTDSNFGGGEEEIMIHEAGHLTSHAGAEFIAARTADKNIISKYARTNEKEDYAETMVAWVGARCKKNRLSKYKYERIITSIPNRLRELDKEVKTLNQLGYDTSPMKCETNAETLMKEFTEIQDRSKKVTLKVNTGGDNRP